MKILHLETSSKNCSVAISEGENLLCLCQESSLNYKQSESLHQFIEWALEGAKIGLNELDAVCLGKGPGSYTGLRIGAASAKGLCFGLNKPLLAVNSMQSMIEPYLNQDFDVVIPLLDARRMEVYTASYDAKTGQELQATQALILDENSFSKYQDQKILFVGNGAWKAQENFPIPHASYNPEVLPSAQYLIRTALKRAQLQQWENITYFEPFYLKEFHS